MPLEQRRWGVYASDETGKASPAELSGESHGLRARHGRGGPRMLFGTLLLGTANVSKIALQFLLLPILARLLGPKVFGLMSVAMSFILLANMLSDGGIGPALVRVEDPAPELRATLFWLSVLIGFALAAFECLLAWPLSIVFAEPQLANVICALSPILILSAMLAVSNAQIIRTQRFHLFAASDIGCGVVSAVVGIAMALQGYGIWSLVGQQLVLWISKAAWVLSMTGVRPAPIFRPRLAASLWRFSANNIAANVTDFIGKSAPTLIVSRISGIAAAGHYSMAYQLTRVADMVISSPVSMATFSAVAVAETPRVAASFVRTALRVLMILLAPLCAGIILTSDLAAPLLLGPKWTATAPVLAALAPGSLLVCVYSFAGAALLGKGHSDSVFRLNLLTSAAVSVGTLSGAFLSVTWAAVGFSVGTAVLVPFYLRRVARIMEVDTLYLLSATTSAVVAVAAMSAAVLFVRSELVAQPPILQLVAAVLSGVTVFCAVLLLIDRQQIRDDIARLRRAKPETLRLDSPAQPSEV